MLHSKWLVLTGSPGMQTGRCQRCPGPDATDRDCALPISWMPLGEGGGWQCLPKLFVAAAPGTV